MERILKSLLTMATAGLFVFVAGCASHSHELKAAQVSTAGYKGYDCTELHSEIQLNINRTSELTGILDEKADDDGMQMAVGMLLFWPVLFALEGGDGEEAAEYSRLKGELNAMEQVAILKKCNGAVEVAHNFREKEQEVRLEMMRIKKEQQSWNN